MTKIEVNYSGTSFNELSKEQQDAHWERCRELTDKALVDQHNANFNQEKQKEEK